MPFSRPIAPSMLAMLLASLAILGPFAVDSYLPAFPDIQSSLQATPLQVQQTLSIYMFAFAMMILWHGALSDAFGRRNIILGSLAVFAIASLGCASAHSVEYLWAFRALQGVSAGAGIVIGRAIIRDLHAGPQAEKLLSLVTMIFSIGPAIAPVIGGWIVKLLNWRAIFLLLFAYTVLLIWICWKRLPETLPVSSRQPFNPRFLWQSYSHIFRTPLFHLRAGAIAFNFAGLFLFVASAPAVVTVHLGLGQDQFAWLFVPAVSGVFLGSLAANRLAGKWPIPRQVRLGFILMLGSGLFNTLYHALYPAQLPWTVAPLFFYTAGMSMVMPGVTLMVLDLFPHIRGIVASCQSFTMTMLAAVVAGALSPLLSNSMFLLAAGQLGFVLLGFLFWTVGQLKNVGPASTL
jgi:DHA1 family bicyclomycin/chloramphenicol resistance-like MFS transporter